MDDDDFDFSDADLDDLPANTLQQLETTALRATQQQPPPPPQSHHAPARHDAVAQEEVSAYYGFDDGDEDEVVNLDDEPAAPHVPNSNSAAHAYQATPRDNGVNAQLDGAIEVEVLPPQSRVDVGRLLERIKKVRFLMGRNTVRWLTAAARAGKTAAEPQPRGCIRRGHPEDGRGRQPAPPH
jgi:hypothetical protein